LSDFPIANKWPAKDPSKIQLYVKRALAAFLARPAVARGLTIPQRPS
jgi:hypothetical protein